MPRGGGDWETTHRKVDKTKSLAVDVEKDSRETKHFTVLLML